MVGNADGACVGCDVVGEAVVGAKVGLPLIVGSSVGAGVGAIVGKVCTVLAYKAAASFASKNCV